MGSSPIFRIKDKVKDTYVSFILIFAEVAELADAQASGACSSNTVRVQVPSSALGDSPIGTSPPNSCLFIIKMNPLDIFTKVLKICSHNQLMFECSLYL